MKMSDLVYLLIITHMEFVCVCVFQVSLRPPGGQYIHYVAPTTIKVAHPCSRGNTGILAFADHLHANLCYTLQERETPQIA